MNLRLFCLFVVAFGSLLANSDAETRTFIDSSGRALQAELVKVNGNMVTLKRASDGQVFTVAASTFSKADQAYFVSKGGGATTSTAPTAPTAATAATAASPTEAKADPSFSVDLISPSKEYLFVDGAWQDGVECIQAKVSTTVDVPGKDASLKAYFFNGEGAIVETVKKPSSQADNNGGTVRPIAQFQKGKKYQVFFGIPDAIKTGASKWKRVIVVFGRTGDLDAKVYPKDELKKFEFPEKSSVSPLRLTQ